MQDRENGSLGNVGEEIVFWKNVGERDWKVGNVGEEIGVWGIQEREIEGWIVCEMLRRGSGVHERWEGMG